ncbi:MAG: hypothetical protein H7039_01050 [Bryobacteraceae bacterium]|nr:hypothetical protein [Bryobacteraceae bacterium]
MKTGNINLAATTVVPLNTKAKKQIDTTSFEEQLSKTITNSLRKLGTLPGGFQISVRNGESAATREITITYTDKAANQASQTPAIVTPAAAGSKGTASAASLAVTPSATPVVAAAGNPFSGKSPDLTAEQLERNLEPTSTPWSPYTGPCDSRDAFPKNGGLLTASGAPDIRLNTKPTRNQYNYSGPAASNPYFTNPGNPLREGYVLGFNQWFQNAAILGPGSTTPANSSYYATEEGAQEALRLVKQHVPEAQLTSKTWGGGGPFQSSKEMYLVTVPGGAELNAGNILSTYYNRGFGTTSMSDKQLQQDIQLG